MLSSVSPTARRRLLAGSLAAVLAVPLGAVMDHPITPTPAVAATAEPAAVSPLVLSGPGNIVTRTQDTYITTADTADHSAGAFLHIGTPDNGTTKYRSLMQFDVSKLRGATIESASLRLYNSYTGSCDGWWMYAQPIAAAWNQSTVTWGNQPGVSSDPTLRGSANFGVGNASGCPDHPNFTDPEVSDGIQRIDVTAMVQRWASGSLPNHGMLLSAGEQETKAYKDFCAMNPGTQRPCTIAYNIPTLEIKVDPGHPVIVATNGKAEQIQFYDGTNPARWASSAAGTSPYLWWAPDAYHSITDTTLVPAGMWGGGVDVKLRPAGHYGSGQVLVVADNKSGFVGVIPYPALSGRKWAINVGGTGVSNIHGAELMPDGNVAVALPKSHKVQVFSAAQGQNFTGAVTPKANRELPGAHQVLYDPEGPWLWGVGDSTLARYPYTPGTGELADPKEYTLPKQGADAAYGHDVSRVAGDPDRLWVGANGGVVQFSKSGTANCAAGARWPTAADSPDMGTRWCGDFPRASLINARRMVKSVSDDPVTGAVAVVVPVNDPDFNGPDIRFVADGTLVSASSPADDKYYKVRWMVPTYR